MSKKNKIGCLIIPILHEQRLIDIEQKVIRELNNLSKNEIEDIFLSIKHKIKNAPITLLFQD